jgi:hypothetical protein
MPTRRKSLSPETITAALAAIDRDIGSGLPAATTAEAEA